jgi:adenosylcobinamide kinase/adenosylcobinamide-phosphate guanylyltransferase
MSVTLVLGGARSGKSRHAEALVRETGLERIYIATAQAFDDEMTARIAHHRLARADDGWTTIEEPLDLPAAVSSARQPGSAVLVDCLTLWLTNIMLAERDVALEQGRLLAALDQSKLPIGKSPIVLVSNEVGLGLVPETPLGRAFRDAQGRLNQALAAQCDHVVFVAAGLPLVLKSA